MPLVDVSGTAIGQATVTGDFQGVIHWVQGTAQGTGDGLAALYRLFITSGFVLGHGILQQAQEDSSGHAYGSSALSGVMLRPVGLSGRATGQGKLFLSSPMPLRGHTILSAYMEVVRVPVPICLRPPVRSYRWGQDFQRGDLAIWLRQIGGTAISPFRVTYALYRVVPGDQLRLVGSAERMPAPGAVGEFYATGVAGQGGQPGRWVIKWHYQVSFNGPTYEEAMEFDVLDAVLVRVPDPNRICKRGWF